MEKFKQIHLQIHLYLDYQKPLSVENEFKWLLGQYYTTHTVLDKLFEFNLHGY